jgi:hypothetical protein
LLSQYSVFKASDVLDDPAWLIAPVGVLFNSLRHAINLEALKLFAKAAGRPLISWRNPLHGSNAASLTAAETNLLYLTHPALSGFFLPGTPAFVETNTKTQLGLFNDARMRLYFLALDKSEDKPPFTRKLQLAQPGELAVLRYPPFSVLVEITDAPPDTFTDKNTLLPGKYIVPLMVDKKSQHESIKPCELLKRQGHHMKNIKYRYRSHAYNLAFSLTLDKHRANVFPGDTTLF